jgi:hypothetical protein
MWRAMRMMPQGFQVRELIALAAVRRKAAEKFLRPLARAGYLRAEGGGSARRYSLLRNTGPIPPRVSATGVVLDVNTEIARERAHHAELLKEIRRVEQRLGRLGAYVEKFQPAEERGEKNVKK